MSLATTALLTVGGFVVLLAMLVAFGLAWYKKGAPPSIPFLMSVIVVGLAVSFFLPTPISASLPSVPPILGLGRLGLLVFLSLAILLWMVFGAWWGSGSDNPEPVARAVARRLEALASTWAGIATLGASLLISLAVILLGEGGEVAGMLAQLVADVPLISSNVAAIGLGWIGAGGALPVVGVVPAQIRAPTLVAGAIALVFTLAVGVTYAD
jgi:membrane-associated HD superfamily phosphohydrolase